MSQKLEEKTPDQTLQEYLDSIYLQSHSTASVNAYKTAIVGVPNGFRHFLKEQYNCDELELVFRIKNEELDVYKVFQEHIVKVDKAGKNPVTIRTWFAQIKGYLSHLGVDIYSEKCKQRIKLPRKIRLRKEALSKQMLVRLCDNVQPKIQTIIKVLVSSGMRVGELAELKLADIDFSSEPTKIKIRAETTKSREDRITFITSEATQSLKDYLVANFHWKEDGSIEQLQSVKIFGRTSIAKNKLRPKKDHQRSTVSLLEKTLLRRIRMVPELNQTYDNGRQIIHYHAFREFFYTNLSNVIGSNFAHALMGHTEYMDTYYNQSEEQQKKLYLRAEPYLTIIDYTKVEKDLEKMQEKQTDIQEKYDRLERFLRLKDPSFEKFLKVI